MQINYFNPQKFYHHAEIKSFVASLKKFYDYENQDHDNLNVPKSRRN